MSTWHTYYYISWPCYLWDTCNIIYHDPIIEDTHTHILGSNYRWGTHIIYHTCYQQDTHYISGSHYQRGTYIIIYYDLIHLPTAFLTIFSLFFFFFHFHGLNIFPSAANLLFRSGGGVFWTQWTRFHLAIFSFIWKITCRNH